MARRRGPKWMRNIRERKYRLQAKTTRFIPDSDSDFAFMAREFGAHVAENAERFAVSAETSGKLDAAVEKYRDALSMTMRPSSAGPMATRIKNTARKELETIVRAAARMVRACETLTSVDRLLLNLQERPKRLKARECPQVAPVLKFIEATNAHKHVLEYGNDFDYGSSAKPHGAARLELFVGLVPPPREQCEIPDHPSQMCGGLVWYVRSYSTSRFEVEYPTMADGRAMLVVYWGRWADARGGVGPFSKTCVTRTEGGAPCLLPEVLRFPSGEQENARGVWGASRKITPLAPLQLEAASDEERVVEVLAARIQTQRMLEAA